MTFLKKTLSLAISLWAGASLAQADYLVIYDLDPGNYIDGEPQELGRIVLENVGDVGTFEGSVNTVYPIGDYGSRYDLWSEVTVGGENKLYFIKSAVVGPYPTVEFFTDSTDPYHEFRTRADHRFGVYVRASNFSEADDAPDEVKQLFIRHYVCEYPDGEYAFSQNNQPVWGYADPHVTEAQLERVDISGPGDTTLTEPELENADGDFLTKKTSMDSLAKHLLDGTVIAEKVAAGDSEAGILGLQRGEELFAVYARPAVGAPLILLAQQIIRVFPVSQAYIRGSYDSFASDSFTLDLDSKLSAVPSLIATCKELYPGSTTRLALYKRDSDGNVAGEVIAVSSSQLIIASSVPQSFNTTVPQSGVLSITAAEIDATIAGGIPDGDYIARVETTTEINGGTTEVVGDEANFGIRRSINVRGNISTQN